MFAGPNGSGKSTVYRSLKHNFDIGIYVNADDIELSFQSLGYLKLSDFNLINNNLSSNFSDFITTHSLFKKAQILGFDVHLELKANKVFRINSQTHSYEASILADYIRQQLILQGKKLTFETVMSHDSKIETLRGSQELGYKNYLYFIYTESVEINKQRVIERVLNGGHQVPIDKIEKRYTKSLNYLKDAIQYTHRTFVFDNSGSKSKLILDICDNEKLTFHSEYIPV